MKYSMHADRILSDMMLPLVYHRQLFFPTCMLHTTRSISSSPLSLFHRKKSFFTRETQNFRRIPFTYSVLETFAEHRSSFIKNFRRTPFQCFRNFRRTPFQFYRKFRRTPFTYSFIETFAERRLPTVFLVAFA